MTNTNVIARWRLPAIAVVVVVGIVAITCFNGDSRKTDSSAVLARVNGEPIYQKDLEAGIDGDSFDVTVQQLKTNKLPRMISQVAIAQFLKQHGVKVKESLVDAEMAKLEANPPSQGCSCCTFPTLEAYLGTIGYTDEQFRKEVRNSIGLSDYASKSWKSRYPDKASMLKQVSNEAQSIREGYVKAWQVFFNTFQQTGDTAEIAKLKRAKAEKAWKRIQAGESFEVVAKSMSEDMTSKHKGGYLGYINRASYGREFDDMMRVIKPDQISKPFESSWGFHIIKWEPLTSNDILKFCESYFVDKEIKRLSQEIREQAEVDSPEQSPGT